VFRNFVQHIEYYGATFGNLPWGICHYRNAARSYGPGCSKGIEDVNWSLCQGEFNQKFLLPSKHYSRSAPSKSRLEGQNISTRVKLLVSSIEENESFYYGHLDDVQTTFELWHIPPSWLHPDHSPYHRNNTALFTIVRNPYDRFVSEFYCPHTGYLKFLKRNTNNTQNVTSSIFNDFLIDRLVDYPVLWTGHYIPQSEFVYDYYTPWSTNTTTNHHQNKNGTVWLDHQSQPLPRQVVHHILRHENLTSELMELMAEYNMSHVFSNSEEETTSSSSSTSTLSSATSSSSSASSNLMMRPLFKRINAKPDYYNKNETTQAKHFTRYDMNPMLIQLINTIYRRDFILFNYTMIDPYTHEAIHLV
jgi:Sulfotransferase family